MVSATTSLRTRFAVCVVCRGVATGYFWLPNGLFCLGAPLDIGARVAFALKADLNLPVFLWLARCVRAVSKGRFMSPDDSSRCAGFGGDNASNRVT